MKQKLSDNEKKAYQKAYMKKYREEKKEEIRANRKEYREKNKDTIKAYSSKYARLKSDRLNELKRIYRMKKKEEADHSPYNAITDKFQKEADAVSAFVALMYPNGVLCPFCMGKARRASGKAKFQCHPCKTTFTILKGTIFEGTHADLRKWLYVVSVFLSSEKNLVPSNLRYDIKVSYKAAARMIEKVKGADIKELRFISSIL